MGDILIAIGVGVVIIIVLIVTMLVISGGGSDVVEAGNAFGGAYKYRIIQIGEREILIIWHSRRTGLAAVELK